MTFRYRKLLQLKLLVAILLTPTITLASMEKADQALADNNYALAKDHYQQQPGYDARYGEGIACYRLKDYTCARDAFSLAAWQADTTIKRAHAVFNLANTHFFNGNFKQAIVLFKEAAVLGIDESKVKLNLEFAESLALSVEKHLQGIKKSEEKAEWRAHARNLPENFLERIANSIYLSRPENHEITLHTLSAQEIKQVLSANIQSFSGKARDEGTNQRARWVKSSKSALPGTTAALMNVLMQMEIGLPVGGESEPYRIKEHRPW